METRRLLRVIALLFFVVLLVQYFEVPYVYVLSNLLPFGKPQVMPAGSFPSSTRAAPSAFSRSNSTEISAGSENSKEASDGNGANGKHNPISSTNKHSDDTFSVNKNDTSSDSLEINNNFDKSESNYSSMGSSSLDKSGMRNFGPAVKRSEEKDRNVTTPLAYLPLSTPITSPNISASSVGKEGTTMPLKNGRPGVNESNLTAPVSRSSITRTEKKRFKGPPSVVVPISEMNNMLLQSRFSYKFNKPQWPSQVDGELLNAKALVEKAQIMEHPHVDVNVYRNFSAFARSYELMEHTLKIYIYAEGERPVFHQPELSGIYASEGWFMKQLQENKHFVTKDANKAHLFYLPFGSHILKKTLYVPNSHSRKNMVRYLSGYVQNIRKKYHFWDRTGGADHFLVACHDWAPAETSRIMKNCIRALCNADVEGGFQFGKDISLPETFIHLPQNPLKDIGGKPPSQRKILAFFAGKMHGYLRPFLLSYWENKDPDMKISGKLPNVKGQMRYIQYMKSSKYCISAKGYEAYTPRVMEAIFYECVPVIISDNYVPPFFETLNWESFAVFVMEKDIPNLKKILLSIPEKRYVDMQGKVKQVQKHFLWNPSPVKYDIFHMILHSIWYTRVSQMRAG